MPNALVFCITTTFDMQRMQRLKNLSLIRTTLTHEVSLSRRLSAPTILCRAQPRPTRLAGSLLAPTRRVLTTSAPRATNDSSQSSTTASTRNTPPTSFFDLKAKDKRQQEVSMADFENKVILVVNVASQCGFTPQYKELEQLYKDYKDQGLVVIGFPCNQFGGQEPGSDQEIESFCQVNFGVTFPLMAKIDVNGAKEDSVYTFLKAQKAGFLGLTRIKWNFEKFLIDRNGTVVQRYPSTTTPKAIADDIKKLL
ncbi:glutathione peroxidase gpx1 [Mortierella alpina]|nr:glutathione peroxidase gpx1 [Mortierella alpina]